MDAGRMVRLLSFRPIAPRAALTGGRRRRPLTIGAKGAACSVRVRVCCSSKAPEESGSSSREHSWALWGVACAVSAFWANKRERGARRRRRRRCCRRRLAPQNSPPLARPRLSLSVALLRAIFLGAIPLPLPLSVQQHNGRDLPSGARRGSINTQGSGGRPPLSPRPPPPRDRLSLGLSDAGDGSTVSGSARCLPFEAARCWQGTRGGLGGPEEEREEREGRKAGPPPPLPARPPPRPGPDGAL
jgi:hypothetical protein